MDVDEHSDNGIENEKLKPLPISKVMFDQLDTSGSVALRRTKIVNALNLCKSDINYRHVFQLFDVNAIRELLTDLI